MDVKTLIRISLASLVVIAFIGLAAPVALADKDQFPQPIRMLWKPTYGTVETTYNSAGAYEHTVRESFKWLHDINLAEVDSPRTASGQGTYEHELRFFVSDTGEVPFCEGAPASVVTDLPQGSYRDTIGADRGEYSWGMPAHRLVQDTLYTIKFDCRSESGPEHNRFNLSAQIGHCHDGDGGSCTAASGTTYADQTNRLIPRKVGNTFQRPHEFLQSFTEGTTANSSFEGGIAPWDVSGGTALHACDAVAAYHKACFARVKPDQDKAANFAYSATPSNTVATSSLYFDTAVRCPEYFNGSSDCAITLAVLGKNSSGSVVQEYSDTFQIPSDDRWREVHIETDGFPTDTAEWRFRVSGQPNDTYQLDYNQEWYLLPE